MSIFESLIWKDGQKNPSGIRTIAYWIPKRDIKSFPTIDDDTAVTPKETVTYNGDFVLHDGKHWFTLYTTQGKGKASFEEIGEKDCKMFTNKANLSYPDITDQGKAFAKATVNSNCIFVIAMPGKRFVVIGGNDYDVTTDIKGDSGDAPGSAKGLTIEVSAPDDTPLAGYIGELKLQEGSLDCKTGVFTATPPPSGGESGG